jgi:hypothetical protein
VSVVRTAIGRVALALIVVASIAAIQFDEYGVKSAFVYNFLHFTEWPESRLDNGAPYVICVFNDSPIVRRLNSQAIGAVNGRPVRVRTATSLSGLGSCHILFLPARETSRVAEVLARYPMAGLLIVTEDQRGDRVDGTINLLLTEGRIRFDINLLTAREQGIQLSSRVIDLARRVVDSDDDR